MITRENLLHNPYLLYTHDGSASSTNSPSWELNYISTPIQKIATVNAHNTVIVYALRYAAIPPCSIQRGPDFNLFFFDRRNTPTESSLLFDSTSPLWIRQRGSEGNPSRTYWRSLPG